MKIVWVIVIIFLGLLGAIIYFFVSKPRPDFSKGLGKIAKWLVIAGLVLLVVFAIIAAVILFIPIGAGSAQGNVQVVTNMQAIAT